MDHSRRKTIEIKNQIKIIEDELIQLRRYFRENPEKSWEEHNTWKKIMEYLDELDVPYIASTRAGVIATIRDKKPDNHIIGARADIDAFPVDDLVGCRYRSEVSGYARICSHDTHITMLLGTAKIFSKIKDELTVTVRLLFQPTEEFIEDSGAACMKNGEQTLEYDRLIVLHIWSQIEAGYASFRYEPVMSVADTFDTYIKDKGGHGVLPHQTIDPVVAGTELVGAFQKAVSREVSPLDTVIASVISFHSGITFNIIPNSAYLMGTCRTFNNELRNHYPDILNRVAQGVAISTRTDIKMEYHWESPVMINDSECVDTGRHAAAKVFGEDKLIDYEQQMGGEDFAKYKSPKCLLMLGGGFSNPEGRFLQHSLYFDIDENILKLGVGYFAQYVIECRSENE